MKQYTEIQRFTQWYIWVVPLLAFFLWLYAFIKQVIFQIPVGSRSASDTEILLIGLIPVSIIVLFYMIRLTTVINNEVLSIRLFPFCSKKIPLTSIVEIEFITYDFVGFGWRLGTKYGTVYNIKGNQGFQIYTKNGDRILVGTQRSNEVQLLFSQSNIHIKISSNEIKL